RLEKEGHIRLSVGEGAFLPFAEGNFFTPSGKAEFYSAALAAARLDPVATFEPPAESRHAEKSRKFPLELLSRKADNFLNSRICSRSTRLTPNAAAFITAIGSACSTIAVRCDCAPASTARCSREWWPRA